MQHVGGQREHQHVVIPQRLGKELVLGRGHEQAQQGLRGEQAQRRHPRGARQREEAALLDRVRGGRALPRADLAGDEDRRARRHHGEEGEDHGHDGVGHADGGQRAAADGADDARKHQADEDGQRVFQHHGQREAQRRAVDQGAEAGDGHRAFLLPQGRAFFAVLFRRNKYTISRARLRRKFAEKIRPRVPACKPGGMCYNGSA